MLKTLFVSLLASALLGAAPPEVRGVWVDRAPLASRESIAAMLDTLKEANFNAVYVNVWSRGYPLWPSAAFEAETGIPIDPEYQGRDVLAEVIQEAGPRGLAVIPWAEYGLVVGYSGRRAPLVEAHPDWLTMDKDGKSDFSFNGFRAWQLSIHHPDARAFMLRMMAELAAYDVPAIQFDRARYPSIDFGYEPSSVELYAKSHDGAAPPATPSDPAWMQWRADAMNLFVADLTSRWKALNWRLLVTNAPVVYRYSYVTFLQDYPAWVKAGSLDFVSPQIYRSDVEVFRRELDNQIAALAGATERLVPGIDVTGSDADRLIRAIELCREKNLPGVVVWFYGDLIKKGALPRLKETVFAEPAPLPWR